MLQPSSHIVDDPGGRHLACVAWTLGIQRDCPHNAESLAQLGTAPITIDSLASDSSRSLKRRSLAAIKSPVVVCETRCIDPAFVVLWRLMALSPSGRELSSCTAQHTSSSQHGAVVLWRLENLFQPRFDSCRVLFAVLSQFLELLTKERSIPRSNTHLQRSTTHQFEYADMVLTTVGYS